MQTLLRYATRSHSSRSCTRDRAAAKERHPRVSPRTTRASRARPTHPRPSRQRSRSSVPGTGCRWPLAARRQSDATRESSREQCSGLNSPLFQVTFIRSALGVVRAWAPVFREHLHPDDGGALNRDRFGVSRRSQRIERGLGETVDLLGQYEHPRGPAELQRRGPPRRGRCPPAGYTGFDDAEAKAGRPGDRGACGRCATRVLPGVRSGRSIGS
jgi:hypothetical protein